MTVVCVSGGFDPVHGGHVDYIEAAAKYGDVVVILNSDDWLKRKKGYCLMPYEDRKRVLGAFRCVKDVVSVDDTDGSVCRALIQVRPDFFANGGDRTNNNTPEIEICGHLGINLLWGVGGSDKKQASSSLFRNAVNALVNKETKCDYRHVK